MVMLFEKLAYCCGCNLRTTLSALFRFWGNMVGTSALGVTLTVAPKCVRVITGYFVPVVVRLTAKRCGLWAIAEAEAYACRGLRLAAWAGSCTCFGDVYR